MKLPHAVAEILAGVAEAEAYNIAVPMAIAVVDAEGGLQLFKRMDGTLPVSTELAVSKAYTAAVLRMPTHKLGELAQPGAPLYGIQQSHSGRIVLFGGGYPLCLDGEVVGAIGVSGGSVEQDMQVAESSAKVLQDVQRWAEEIKGLLPAATRATFALPMVKEKLLRAFAGLSPDIPEATLTALTGGVLLALA
jgi:uncharacterized protein GlcG (DUF336 family)